MWLLSLLGNSKCITQEVQDAAFPQCVATCDKRLVCVCLFNRSNAVSPEKDKLENVFKALSTLVSSHPCFEEEEWV